MDFAELRGWITLGIALGGALMGVWAFVRATRVHRQQQRDREPDIRVRADPKQFLVERLPILSVGEARKYTHEHAIRLTAENHGRVPVVLGSLSFRVEGIEDRQFLVLQPVGPQFPHELKPGYSWTVTTSKVLLKKNIADCGTTTGKPKVTATDAIGQKWECEFVIDMDVEEKDDDA